MTADLGSDDADSNKWALLPGLVWHGQAMGGVGIFLGGDLTGLDGTSRLKVLT